VATWTALITAKPEDVQADKAWYEMGFTLIEAKKDKEAADAFRSLATKLPKSPLVPESWFRVGEFHEAAKQFPEAIQAYTAGMASAKPPELREKLQYKLGWAQYQKELFADAAATLQAQIKEHPQGKLLIDAAFLAAESLYRLSKFAEAAPLFAQVVTAKPEKYLARALYRSGICNASLQQWPASQAGFAALIQQFPAFELVNEARYGLGYALQKQNKLDEASATYLLITKSTDTETAAKSRFMMGEIAFSQKNYKDAIEHFLEAAVGYPYEEWQALGYFEAGRCFIELKETTKAKETLEMVVAKFPKHPKAKEAAVLIATLK
jgi:TolA-binding protein